MEIQRLSSDGKRRTAQERRNLARVGRMLSRHRVKRKMEKVRRTAHGEVENANSSGTAIWWTPCRNEHGPGISGMKSHHATTAAREWRDGGVLVMVEYRVFCRRDEKPLTNMARIPGTSSAKQTSWMEASPRDDIAL